MNAFYDLQARLLAAGDDIEAHEKKRKALRSIASLPLHWRIQLRGQREQTRSRFYPAFGQPKRIANWYNNQIDHIH